jgi:hypothetical protein
MSSTMKGKLSGRLMDANGRQGTMEIELRGDNQQASWTARITERDSNAVVLRGEFPVKFDERGIQVESGPLDGKKEPGSAESAQPSKGEGDVKWGINLTSEPAGRYAESAFVGGYSAQSLSDSPLLTRGVMILWQFK